jgi:thiamine biosynthesis protein ThiI
MTKLKALSRPSRTTPFDGVVVHYHEIGLKGRNRGYFERRLVQNLSSMLDPGTHGGVELLTGRLFVHTEGRPGTDVLDRVGRTFGVASYAPARCVDADVAKMNDAALELLAGRTFSTFAVAARRATKDFHLTSHGINVELGAAVQAATGAGVNLGAPDATVRVEVVGKRSFVYVERHEGPGGLPVGVSGRVVSLLSGGIDSPVATYRACKRGAKASLCHFHSAPFTDNSSLRKAAELARLISDWQGVTTLYLVPLGDAQQEIVLQAPPDLRVVLYRRLMVRIAAEVAEKEGAKALVTGDSLGQVASQTLENIACVDDAAPLPVLRPLIGDDKQEIVTQAQKIGTYETSILPFEDCCSLFVPRSPATRATVDACREAESHFDTGALVANCIEKAEVERISSTDLRRTA